MAVPNNGDNPLSHLGFQRFGPSAKLSSIVDSYWFINKDYIDSFEYLHPDGGIGIIINYGDSLEFDDNLIHESCTLDGTNTLARRLRFKGTLKAIGIRFKPSGASMFFSSPLSEIKNETISLADTTFMNHADLYYKLSKTRTLYSKVLIIEDWLCRSAQTDKRVSKAVEESLVLIKKHNGLLPIKAMAKQVGYHQRKIERLFNLQVGMTPKEYSQNLRIEHARACIKYKKDCSFAAIAANLAYYDQAHFIKQFKKVEAITPSEYLLKASLRK